MRKVFGVLLAAIALAATACNSEKLATEPPTPTPPPPTPTPGAPVAVITGGTSYAPLATADLSGTSSTAPAGQSITAWAWSVTSRPAGSASNLTTPNASTVTLFVDVAGDYTISLTVTDTSGQTGSTSVTLSAVPTQGLHVELTWVNQYTQADMDLHLVNTWQQTADAQIFDGFGCGGLSSLANNLGCDCGYQSCAKTSNGITYPVPETLDWAQLNYAPDDPSLDIDNIDVSLPENINIVKPAAGTYEVFVHYYSAEGNPSILVDATVNVFFGGTQAWTGQQHYDTINQLWDVGTVTVAANGSSTFTPKPNSTTSTSNLTQCQMPASIGGGPCS